MTQYIGCAHAQELLEGLVDGELSMADQLTVESHLRWCRTCALRVEDMRLIGDSLRHGSAAQYEAAEQAVTALGQAVLMRVRAEEAQSVAVRVRETFSDMRMFWPAVGATAAVALCVSVASSVLHATSIHHRQSLASVITTLSNPAPLKPAENAFFGISIPRPTEIDALRTGGTLDALPDDDVLYTVRTVVDGHGRVSYSEVLLADGRDHRAVHASHDKAVLDAIAQTRFAAASPALGHQVAFDMVWVLAKTTAVAGPPAAVTPPDVTRRIVKDPEKPAVDAPIVIDGPRSSTPLRWRFRRLSTA